MKTTVIAVVGGKRSGKTTTIETLTKELTRRGYRIAAIKHVSEPDFTMDKEGKDSWRYAQSGAETIIIVSLNETVTIQKGTVGRESLKDILQKAANHDIVFIEGLKSLVSMNRQVHKIAVVKSAEEAREALQNFKPILAFAGPHNTTRLNPKIPYADVLRDPKRMADIVEALHRKKPEK